MRMHACSYCAHIHTEVLATQLHAWRTVQAADPMCVKAQTQIYMDTYKFTRAHTNIYTYTHAQTHMHMHTLSPEVGSGVTPSPVPCPPASPCLNKLSSTPVANSCRSQGVSVAGAEAASVCRELRAMNTASEVTCKQMVLQTGSGCCTSPWGSACVCCVQGTVPAVTCHCALRVWSSDIQERCLT